MANPILSALRANRLIPTPHWQPRCDLCRLRRTHPDDYDWLTQQILEGTLTQAEIAAEISTRTGLSVQQSQVSTHKTKHLDPTIRDAYETFIARSLTLQALGDMPAEEMALAYAQLALIELGKRLSDAGNREVGGIASAMASLSKAVQSGAKLPQEIIGLDLANTAAAARAAAEEGALEETFVRFVEEHYPDLAPLLANPERLRAVLAGGGHAEA